MTSPEPDTQAQLDRARRAIVIVLGALAVASVVAAVVGVWPAPVMDELSMRWFDRTSLRLRIGGCFCAYGLVVLAGLVLVLLIQRLGRRNPGDR